MICCHGHTRSTSNTDLSVRRGVACMLTLVSGMLHPPAQAVSQLASRSRQPTCWRRPMKVAGQYKKTPEIANSTPCIDACFRPVFALLHCASNHALRLWANPSNATSLLFGRWFRGGPPKSLIALGATRKLPSGIKKYCGEKGVGKHGQQLHFNMAHDFVPAPS